jgi:serralysin
MTRRQLVARYAGMIVFAASACPALASFHTWRISEVYSNAAGNVQFIEFQQPSSVPDDERFVNNQTITTSAAPIHSFTIVGNLPSAPLANSYFLVGTPDYAALASAPDPDYTLPAGSFFNISGDTLTFAVTVDTLTFGSGALPTNGTDSLTRTSWGSGTTTTGAATPTNFAGQTGTVPEPSFAVVLLVIAAGAGLRARRA